MKLAKAQKPDFGRIIASRVLEETNKRKSQLVEEVDGQGKEWEQINLSHTSYVRRGLVPLSRCQPTRYSSAFGCETVDDGNYEIHQPVPRTGGMPSRFSDFIPKEAFESYQIDHKSIGSME